MDSAGALSAYRYGRAVVVSPMEGLSPMVTVLLSLIILHVVPNPIQIADLLCAAFAMYALSKFAASILWKSVFFWYLIL